MRIATTLRILFVAATLATSPSAQVSTTTVALRNVTRLHNSNPEELTGVGLVVGLNATGSSASATRRALTNFVLRHGLNVPREEVAAGSAALVSVTCTLPPFAHESQQLDVRVQSIGDASSLRGGRLLTTELRAVDGEVYATASGQLFVNGFAAQSQNQQATRNHPVAGQIPNGGLVRRELEYTMFSEAGDLELQLLTPSVFNASSVASAASAALRSTGMTAHVVDAGLVRIPVPDSLRNAEDAVRLLAMLGSVPVQMENPSAVVIDEANGVVIAGAGVQISPCMMALSEFTVIIDDNPEISQPDTPFGGGETRLVPTSRIEAGQTHTPFFALPSTQVISLDQLLGAVRDANLTGAEAITAWRLLVDAGYLPDPVPAAASPGDLQEALRVSQLNPQQLLQAAALLERSGLLTRPTPREASVADLVRALGASGLNPQQTMNVFQQLKKGGYLHAELVMQ